MAVLSLVLVTYRYQHSYANDFWTGILSPGIMDTDPRWYARRIIEDSIVKVNRQLDAGRKPEYVSRRIAKCWGAYVNGNRMGQIPRLNDITPNAAIVIAGTPYTGRQPAPPWWLTDTRLSVFTPGIARYTVCSGLLIGLQMRNERAVDILIILARGWCWPACFAGRVAWAADFWRRAAGGAGPGDGAAGAVVDGDLMRSAFGPRAPERRASSFDALLSMIGSPTAVTPNRVLQLATVYACVRILAESLSMLPLVLYQRDGRIRTPATAHSLYPVLHDLWTPEITSTEARMAMMYWLALHGNAYAQIVRDNGRRVRELWPLAADRMTVDRNQVGELIYIYQRDTGEQRVCAVRDPAHPRSVHRWAAGPVADCHGAADIRPQPESLHLRRSVLRQRRQPGRHPDAPGQTLRQRIAALAPPGRAGTRGQARPGRWQSLKRA